MCLAIYKPKGVSIAKKYLKNGFSNNEDGAGFTITKDGKLETFKGYFTFGAFWKAYKGHQGETAIIHFRMATHGKCNAENCHPFTLCGEEFAIIHNGILDIDTKSNKDRSDTFHFTELVLQPMFAIMPFDAPALRYLIETSIGTGNKIVALRRDGQHVIFNEGKGAWHKGAWFSNSSYERRSIFDYMDDYPYMGKKYPSIAKSVTKEAFPDYNAEDWTADCLTEEEERDVQRYLAQQSCGD